MKVESQQLKAFLLDTNLVSESDLEKIEKKAKKNKEDLGIALIKGGKISENQLCRLQGHILGIPFVDLEEEKKAKKNKEDLGIVLIKEGKISENQLRRLQGHILGIPFVDLEEEKIDFSILSTIPEPIARSYNIIAFKKDGNKLEVAMLDPQDLEAIDFIKKKSNLKILPRLTTPESVKSALQQYQRSLKAEFKDIIKKESEAVIKPIQDSKRIKGKAEDLKKMAEDLPIVKILDTLLHHAIIQMASDIHIEPMERRVLVRYRIDGVLRDAMDLPKEVSEAIIARIKILSKLKLDEKRLPQDGRFKIETSQEKVSFRVSVMPTYGGEKAVLRLLHESSKGFTLEKIGFHGEQLDDLHKVIKQPHGMVLATGPTGCGKTTTLYTLLDILNTPDVNICTIEDPIEYQIPRINQTQVKPDIGFTFANGLRSLVRQDPDIIMVGEIRDNETAALAVHAALTGHLVLSTLHTNSAAGAVPRLLDMKVEPFLLASTVNAVVAQRLVRVLCTGKESYKLSKKELDELGEEIDLVRMLEILKKLKAVKPNQNWEDLDFYKPKPSKDCPDGYKSRIGVHEVLMVTETIKELIIKNVPSDDIEAQAKKEGMLTMFEDGILKCVQGITTLEEVFRVTRE